MNIDTTIMVLKGGLGSGPRAGQPHPHRGSGISTDTRNRQALQDRNRGLITNDEFERIFNLPNEEEPERDDTDDRNRQALQDRNNGLITDDEFERIFNTPAGKKVKRPIPYEDD